MSRGSICLVSLLPTKSFRILTVLCFAVCLSSVAYAQKVAAVRGHASSAVGDMVAVYATEVITYGGLLKSRRQQLHHKIAVALEDSFPDKLVSEPELLAHHYTAAALIDQAIPYWLRAGHNTNNRAAFTESIGHLARGLDLALSLRSGSDRDFLELDFQSALGTAYLALKGWASAEAGEAFARAVELSRQVSDTQVLLLANWGLWAFNLVKGELSEARRNADLLMPRWVCLSGIFGRISFRRGQPPPPCHRTER